MSKAFAIHTFWSLHGGFDRWDDDDEARKEGKPKYFWRHQAYDAMRANDETRGFVVDREALKSQAASYLALTELQANYFDWLFLDSLVFAELDALTDYVVNTKGGTGVNLAKFFAGTSHIKYWSLFFVLSLVGMAFRWVLLPAVAIYLATNGHEQIALGVGVVWLLYMLLRLLGLPARIRARKKSGELLQHLVALYALLGSDVVSPRKLKEKLDEVAASGVVLDGAVFSLADRILARDPTAFIPAR